MTDTPTTVSLLARLQQTLVLTGLAAALFWMWLFWPQRPWWAALGVVAFVSMHAVVLALECLLAAWVNRTDATPQAGWSDWLGAWWDEVKVAPVVFAWRQPFCWRRLPDSTAPNIGNGPAVVLVHGFVCNRGLWLPWMNELRARNMSYVSVNLQPVFGSIDAYHALLEAAVSRAEQITGLPPVVVCHSMGGLAVRSWLAGQSKRERLQTVITIGTPHRGTWLSRWSSVVNGRQMIPGCAWLADLEAREQAASPRPYANFVCWYSNADNIVFPASTATLPGADNRLVAGAAHVAMAYDPRVMRETMALVNGDDARA